MIASYFVVTATIIWKNKGGKDSIKTKKTYPVALIILCFYDAGLAAEVMDTPHL